MKTSLALLALLLMTHDTCARGKKGSHSAGASFSYTYSGKTFTYNPPQPAAHVNVNPPLKTVNPHYPRDAASKIFNGAAPK